MKEVSLKASIRHRPSPKHFQSTNLFDRSRDCSIEFFKTEVDQEAFHTQCYNKACDIVCGHEKSDENVNEFSTCAEWYIEDGSERLECPICEQWFHQTCFCI